MKHKMKKKPLNIFNNQLSVHMQHRIWHVSLTRWHVTLCPGQVTVKCHSSNSDSMIHLISFTWQMLIFELSLFPGLYGKLFYHFQVTFPLRLEVTICSVTLDLALKYKTLLVTFFYQNLRTNMAYDVKI